MSIIPSIAREKSKEKAVGKDKITAVTNAQMLNIKESLNQEVRIRNEEETKLLFHFGRQRNLKVR